MKYLASLFAVLFAASAASAATTPNSFIAPQTPRMTITAFVQGTDAPSTSKPVFTGGTNGSKCTFVLVTSSDAAAHPVAFLIIKSAGSGMTLSLPSVPAYAGANSAPVVLFGSGNSYGYPSDSDGNPYIYLQTGDQIAAYYTTALGTGGALQVQAQCVDF